MKGTSEEVLNGWFNTFQQILQEYNIKENIYNMDESRFSIVINTQIRQKYQAQLGQQEWVSVVECIYTDGTSIPVMDPGWVRTRFDLGADPTNPKSKAGEIGYRVQSQDTN